MRSGSDPRFVEKVTQLASALSWTEEFAEEPVVIVVMPAYNAARTVARTVAAIPAGVVDDVLVVDDASKDDTVAHARQLPVRVIALTSNVGYGGNQKVCYQNALEAGADIVVMVHPDGQYDPALIPAMIAPLKDGKADLVLGSRMLTNGGARAGGMPMFRFVFNKILTRTENLFLGSRYSDAHTGYRAYSRSFLETVPFMRNSNDFVFDTQVLAQAMAFEQRIAEVPIHTIYHDEASSTTMKANIVYGTGTLWTALRYGLHRFGMKSRLFER